jgi:uncharacterized short protein YbdD (DUF466 family)
VKRLLARLAEGLRIVIGAPRYDAYRQHIANHHPHQVPLSRGEFERSRLDAKYSTPGAKCC